VLQQILEEKFPVFQFLGNNVLAIGEEISNRLFFVIEEKSDGPLRCV
jgi:hypothetical protein